MRRTQNYGLPIIESKDRYSKEEQNNAMDIIDGELHGLSQSFKNVINDVNTSIENALINSKDGSYSILTSNKNHANYKSLYKQVLSWANVSILKENLQAHIIEFESKYENKFYESINNFKYPTLSDSFVKDYTTLGKNTKYSTLNERLSVIESQIEENFNKSTQDTKFNTKEASKHLQAPAPDL